MLSNLILSALIWGPSDCPSPAQVDARLDAGVARQRIARLKALPGGVQVELSDLHGTVLETRVLEGHDCDALADAVAALVRLRSPLQVPRADVAHAEPARRAEVFELALEGGAVFAPAPRAFAGRFWLTAVHGPLTVSGAVELIGAPLQVSFIPAVGLRHALDSVTLDALIGAPVGLVHDSLVVDALVALRCTVPVERLAPFVQLGLALPLVKAANLQLPAVSLSLTLGLRGGLW